MQFGFGFGLGYWALVKVPANIAGVMLAAIPLFTLFFAVLSRTEPITIRGVTGALISLAGVAVIIGSRGAGAARVPTLYLLAMVGFTAALGVGLVIAKRYSRVQPAVMNAGGMLVGGSLLLVLSFLLAEPKPEPTLTPTWAVQLYVIVVGSVAVFALMLFVVRRWTATAASYQTVLSPPITIMLSALLLGEPIGWGLVAGTAIVLFGVYIGALTPRHCREALNGTCADTKMQSPTKGPGALQPESDRSRSSLLPRRPSVAERNNPTCVRSQQARGRRSVLVPSEWRLHPGPLLYAGLPLLSSRRGHSQLGEWHHGRRVDRSPGLETARFRGGLCDSGWLSPRCCSRAG